MAKTTAKLPNLGQSGGKQKNPFSSVSGKTFPIVGIGASAGGLKAFTKLLEAIPTDIGMAFVLVQHLDPTQKSLLPETLARTTPLSFVEVTDGTKITKNHIYAMPSQSYMTIVDHSLHLTLRKKRSGFHKPIDSFFESLAKHHGEHAIGIVLSGTGNDGTAGIQAIKQNGGRTFAQDASAQFKDMPRSAVDSGRVDFTLPPHEIARTLIQISRGITTGRLKPKSDRDNIDAVLILLKEKTGMDFRQYKQTSVNRRIQRRMLLSQIKTAKEYAVFLTENPSELIKLHKDMLIHVTNFFREPEQFGALKKLVFPLLLKNRSPKNPIKIWIPGCATGEEAYTYAIVFQEFFAKLVKRPAIQILATDIAKDAIDKARKGIYGENITDHISSKRLRKFFSKVSGGYRVKKPIRDMCEFAVADLTQKPLRLDNDFVSCRNVLIYLGESLQQKAFFMLSSALKPDGFLLLGKSEGLGASAKLFSPLDNKHRVYSKKAVTPATDPDLTGTHDLQKTIAASVGMNISPGPDDDHVARQQRISKLKDAVGLTQDYANEIISELDVVNEELQSTNEELTSSNEELQTTNEELQTLQEELQTSNEEMATLNEELQTRNEEVTRALNYADAIVRTVRESLVILDDNLRVVSANETFYETFMVNPKETENMLIYDLGNKQWDIPKLRKLLEKILLQNIIIEDFEIEHDFETIGQKIMLLNVRRLLQGPKKTPLILLSIEDITERKKIERLLQESEERLRFMAETMPQKIFTAIPTGEIDYFNPQWMEFTGLTFEQIRDWGWTKFIHPDDLEETVRSWKYSIDTGESFELEHRFRRFDGDYHWHLSRALPMRDKKGKTMLWVGSNTDINEQKKSENEQFKSKAREQAAKDNLYSLLMHAPAIVAVISGPELVFEMANTPYRQLVGRHRQLDGRPLLVAIPEIESSHLKIIKNVATKGERFIANELPILLDWDGNAKRYTKYLNLVYEPLFDENKKPYGLMCFGYDVSAQVADRQSLEVSVRSKDEFIGIVSHELKTPITTMKGYSEILEKRLSKSGDSKDVYIIQNINKQTDRLTDLVNDLLNVNRIQAGKLVLEKKRFDLNDLITKNLSDFNYITETHQISKVGKIKEQVLGDQNRIEQVVSNLITNAIKYSPKADKVIVRVVTDKKKAIVSVQDFGLGINKREQTKVFERFYRTRDKDRMNVAGFGLGLYISAEIIKGHNGKIWIESTKGEGSTFYFTLPLSAQKPKHSVHKTGTKNLKG